MSAWPRRQPRRLRGIRSGGWYVLLLTWTALLTSCSSESHQVDQHEQQLISLGATTVAIGGAWADGLVSGRFARTALTETFQLVVRQEQALASTPDTLQSSRLRELSDGTHRLSLIIALALQRVEAGDAPGLRRQMDEVRALTKDSQ